MTFPLDSLRHTGPVLCAGLDPSAEILHQWGFPDTADGLNDWVATVTEAVVEAGLSIVKPQVAFFERHGVGGMRSLAHLQGALRSTGVRVIADAKRGDIGNSVQGYGEAWLTPGSDFEADALTVHPYHGISSLAGVCELAQENQKTVFVLAATSNPESEALQSARLESGQTVSRSILEGLQTLVATTGVSWSAVGAVVGATVDQGARGLALEDFPELPILAPGYGAQGAPLSEVSQHFAHQNLVIPVSARGLLSGGLDEFQVRVSAAQGLMAAP